MISVIVPFYNVENYIEKCIKSILEQTYMDLEIILVNDGSTDGSERVAKQFEDRYSNIKLFSQKNMGLAAARNIGLDNCSGEWISFIDSDDWIEPNMYEILLNLALKYNADISSCKTRIFRYGIGFDDVDDSNKIYEFTPHQMIDGLITQEHVRYEVWNKLWKKELIGNTRFIAGQVSEDIFFDRTVFLKAKKMVHIEKSLHNYLLKRPGSTYSSFKIGRMAAFEEYKQLIEEAKKKGWMETAEKFNNVATEFAIGMYEEAYFNAVKKDTLKILNNNFKYFYSRSKKKIMPKKLRLKSWLFNFSPVFFMKLLKFKGEILFQNM